MFKFIGQKENKPALILLTKDGREIVWSWNEYYEKALIAAHSMRLKGVRESDLVAIIPLNLPESFAVMLGIILLGAIPVPINPRIVKEPGQKELKAILDDCNPQMVLVNECLEKHLEDTPCMSLETLLNSDQGRLIQPKTKFWEKEPFIIPYTSGTTGGPKGVVLGAGCVFDRVSSILKELDTEPSERILSYLPLGHISELVASFFGQLQGGYCVYFTEHIKDIVDNPKSFRTAFPRVLQKIRPTAFLAAPRVWANFRTEIRRIIRFIPVNLNRRGLVRYFLAKKVRRGLGLSMARVLISAAAKLSTEDREFFASLGMHIYDIYGQTETGGPLLLDGEPIGNTYVIVGRDEHREIMVTGQNVMLGYYNNKTETEKVLDGGIYHTDDIGRIDPDGRIFYAGRLGDRVKNAQGEFVDPEKIDELESQIRQIPGVGEVAVYVESKPYPVAIIFGAAPFEELRHELEKSLPIIGGGFYRVKNFMIVDISELELLLTPTFKLKRKAVFDKFKEAIERL